MDDDSISRWWQLQPWQLSQLVARTDIPESGKNQVINEPASERNMLQLTARLPIILALAIQTFCLEGSQDNTHIPNGLPHTVYAFLRVRSDLEPVTSTLFVDPSPCTDVCILVASAVPFIV